MKLKNKIFMTLLFPVIVVIIWLLIYKNHVNKLNKNILNAMEDGIVDSTILEFYQNEIEEVKEITNGEIIIYHFTVDLNKDGQLDKIVYIKSPLHSGSNGDTVNILIDENGKYRKVLTGVYRLFDQNESPIGAIYIRSSKQEDFSDIKIISDGNQMILQYKDGMYRQ